MPGTTRTWNPGEGGGATGMLSACAGPSFIHRVVPRSFTAWYVLRRCAQPEGSSSWGTAGQQTVPSQVLAP